MNCKTCNKLLTEENKQPYTKDGKQYFRKECRPCYLAKIKAKRDENKVLKPILDPVYYKGMSCIPQFSHCQNESCGVLLDENTRHFRFLKYIGREDKLVSSSLCKSCKSEDIKARKRAKYAAMPKVKKVKKHKEPKPKYCKDCNILLSPDNCYTSKRVRLDGSVCVSLFPNCKDCDHKKQREKRASKRVLTKKEKIVKVKKEKTTTLKKKLHKENVEPITKSEDIVIYTSRKLSGREQCLRVFAEQKRRRERTQKEINDEKNLFLDIGMR